MNLGRGFPVPQERQTIRQNGNLWLPATPDVQRLSYPQQPETQQPNHTGQENWQDLLGIYTGLLQEEPNCRPPKKLNVSTYVGPNYREHNIQDVGAATTCGDMSQSLVTNGFAEKSHMEPSNRYTVISSNFNQNEIFSPNFHQAGVIPSDFYQNGVVTRNFHRNGVNLSNFQRNGASSSNFREHNIQNVGPIENFRRLNQNAGSVIPRKVTSLAELLGNMSNSQRAPLANGTPSRSAYIAEKLPTFHPPSQAQSSQSTNYESAGALLHQRNLIMQANHNNVDYNLPQTANIRPSVTSRPSYNLNFPPISEVGEPSNALKLLDQLWPATPDQQKQPKNNYQTIQEQVSQVNEIPNQEKDSQGNCVISQQSEIVEKNSNGFMQSASSVAIFTSSKEKNNLDGGNEIGIDLNNTPAQKTPRRKKHRPKVIKEGKPKRTPKPQNNTPSENPIEKRKYVRRKGVETPKTPSTDVVKEPEVSQIESAAKSCKRSLNFDSENKTVKAKRKYVRRKGIETSKTASTDVAKEPEVSKVESAAKSCRRSLNFDLENKSEKESGCKDFDYRAKGNERHKMSFDLNLDSNPTEWSAEITDPSSFAPKGQQEIYNKEKQQADIEQISEDSVPITTQPAAPNNHALNIIARSLSFRNANMNQSGIGNRYDRPHHHLGGGHAQIVIQTSNDEPNLGGRMQPMLSSKPQFLESSMNIVEKQSSQRDNSRLEVVQSQSVTLMGSELWSNGISGHSSPSLHNCSESISKGRADGTFHGTSSRVIPEITNKSQAWSSQAQSCTSTDLVAFLNSADWRFNFQQEMASSQVHQRAERLSRIPPNMQGDIFVPTAAICNQQSASGNHPKFTRGKQVLNSPVSKPLKGQAEHTSLSEITILDKMPEKEITNSRSKRTKGLGGRKRKLFTVDDLEDLLKYLTLGKSDKNISQAEQNALVPYRGFGGIVPYEAFDPIKKRPPRPRVDLDPETNRLWNLLMGKEASESAETADTDKQKWWEEERKVFRGRVDSFIARMHLVQGDRRFSKWKGSVVDSVIGVFLTQNVSDHLSSSAFMSLAARFPLKLRYNGPECSQNGKSQSAERYQVRVTYPDEPRPENGTQGTQSHLENDNSRTEEDIISSQSSSESFVYQASEDIRSSSGSNSETEDQLMQRNFNLNHVPANHAEQAKRTAPLHQHQFQAMGMDKRPLTHHLPSGNPSYGQYLGVDDAINASFLPFTQNTSSVIPPTRPWLSMLMGPEECTSSLTSGDFGSTIENQFGESSYMSQVEKTKIQASFAHHGIVNKHIGQQTSSSSQAAPQGISAQHFINSRQESFQTERTFASPTEPAEDLSKQSSGNLHKYPGLHFDNQASIFAHNLEKSESVTPRPSETVQVHASGGPSDTIGNAIPNGKKRKAEKLKAEPIKWDVLREEAEKKHGPYEGINVNAMDSLDYEALRNADVGVISDAIKERGMNNMLAERMKDFLNRIVRDHGKVDLEWLRDVQPEKAKDYLLSIRGLGLKSVECVRLLTLHHLAFPVDTNVGRIAVRLGWVPLQPLPESLQLHLLEMYPILESIQKFLWPRLCKLDQETLYELHYQMITFGKVFCTKRDPNCNACPMRGECRHFASAFASARLALPGPEEKRIVPSADPITAKKGFDVNIPPVPLLQGGFNFEGEREMGLHNPRSYEPIIEEPSTPEAPVEVLERDIEDAFYEDPDEIPVIKLNLEEFTTNLQNFMQENMEMQDGEMSRALVALDPELASIPTPKLKHVSRLRTEHQVYELPDSHPLLKEMDRREPDDPSPYMLAIWTPGETADSVQPPESKCSSQGGGPCNLSTCFACNSTREAHTQTVRGTILIPCRTAMRGSFPLNGTYFQVNELFADHESSLNPIDVPRSLLWNLPRRTVFFGTSVTSIFKGLSTQDIQFAFWKGFVCVRGFDKEHRAPRPLRARLHFTASKMKQQQNEQRKKNESKKA